MQNKIIVMSHPNKKIMEQLIRYTEKYVKYGNATGAFLVNRNEKLWAKQ